ncbi:hypothetical protein AG1IA_06132 [Rhizoctonia solani AG-1 IA]|uniref:Uncharacterized protein n=1 Tax=Thanatephorus cucumeris (strain AG1-IA) TaxID=983506 RepID=L8WNY3_THACA|nr:hypothetical protein AG1IA_06132 [Rhizoctonia solani AG-1 IA]
MTSPPVPDAYIEPQPQPQAWDLYYTTMSNFTAASVQSTTYTAERAKQETSDVSNIVKEGATESQDDFQSKVDAAANEARVKKEEAVAEGKADVEQAKATTASYMEQARDLVGAALGKAQTYVSAGQERLGATTTHSTAHVRTTGHEGPHAGGLTNTLTGVAVSALQTTKGVLATAQAQLAATGQSTQSTAKPHSESPRPTTPSYKDTALKSQSDNAPNPLASDPVVDTPAASAPSISSTTATAGSASSASTETPSVSSQIASPATISYPAEPKTESHHVTTEGGAPPPEKVDDKAVNKLAEGLTSTKISDASPATSTH